MKKYKLSFFFAQAFKGMFRNGMMTIASVIVLLACLTALGCFSILVANIDYNLGSLESLNEMVVFVDTTTSYYEDDSITLPPAVSSTDGRQFLGWSLTRGATEADYQPGQIYKVLPSDSIGGKITFYAVWDGASESTEIKVFYNTSGVKVNESVGFVEEIYTDGDKITLLDTLTARGSAIEFLGWSTIPNASDAEFKGGIKFRILNERAKDGIITLYAVWSEMPTFAKFDVEYDMGSGVVENIPIDSDLRLENVKKAVATMLEGEAIDNVEFVSKEQTLADEMEQLKDYPGLETFFAGSANPYPDTFIITYNDEANISAIENKLMTISDVYKIRCNSDIAKNISELKNGVSVIFFWFAVVLFAVSVLVIVNTVKLAVEYRSKEIVIMRYIGATKGFIALPFELEGAIIGLFAGCVSFVIQWIGYGYISKLITLRLSIVSILSFGKIALFLIPECLLIGVVTGFLGSVIAIYKYLKA